ncbi:hypothetical protein OG21DRAFT_1487965 [Imleria badia]|nr:hypothetical protein OG21DRAFT_1487965 [Imleria badia]
MYPRVDAASDFDYPDERLLKLRDILSAEEMRIPNNKNRKGEPARYSHVRRYFSIGACDPVEAAIYACDNDSGPFSKGGDSGSIIVNPLGKFIALITGGTGPTNSSDITYATPMYWLWEIIKAKFPGANLYFEDN